MIQHASSFALILGLVGIIGLHSEAQATFSVLTASGTSAGVPVSSKATFTTSAGQVALTLENTTIHTADAGQLLTGIRFTLSPTPITTATLTAATAIPREIASNGTYFDGPAVSILGTWQSNLNAGVYQLDFNPNAEFGIVGPADGETGTVAGVYTANGSITGNPGHNPFTAKLASFILSSADITAGTTISNVSFIYNTGLSTVIPAQEIAPPPPIPEPSSLGFALAIFAACGTSRRRKAPASA